MTVSPVTSPSEEEARALYERLLAGDPTAPSDFAVAYLDCLTDWLVKHNWSTLHPNDCATAAGEAILALIKNPKTYNPKRQTLEVYLRKSAQGDLMNILRSERRHRKGRADWEAVEHSSAAGKYLGDEETNPEFVLERRQEEARTTINLPSVPESVQAGLTSEEEKVLELIQMRERRTAVYAVALGISQLSFGEQKKEVKKVKDRLKKRLERARGSDG